MITKTYFSYERAVNLTNGFDDEATSALNDEVGDPGTEMDVDIAKLDFNLMDNSIDTK